MKLTCTRYLLSIISISIVSVTFSKWHYIACLCYGCGFYGFLFDWFSCCSDLFFWFILCLLFDLFLLYSIIWVSSVSLVVPLSLVFVLSVISSSLCSTTLLLLALPVLFCMFCSSLCVSLCDHLMYFTCLWLSGPPRCV